MIKKRVGIDGHMIGDRSGGNESYYKNILQNMDFSDTNIHPILFLRKGVDDSLFKKTFEIVRLESENAFVRNFIELPSLCKKYKLSLLHTQYFIPFVRPCPVVCTIHDICFEHFKDIFTKKEYYRQKVLIPYSAKKSAAVFTVSNHAKNDIQERYHISESKIYVTYNAVNSSFRKLNEVELNEIELREKFQIGNESFLLCVGNLQPRKNLPRLIRAYRKYSKYSVEHSKLVIVGKKAWMFNEVIKEALEGTDDVVLTDYVSDMDLVRLYNAAYAFIYPSYYEGFGIPPLEALACGTPVAVANATSLPEVVGNAGVYFDPFNESDITNAIDIIMNNRDARQSSVEKSVDRVNYFSWEKSADIIIKTYQEIIMEKMSD